MDGNPSCSPSSQLVAQPTIAVLSLDGGGLKGLLTLRVTFSRRPWCRTTRPGVMWHGSTCLQSLHHRIGQSAVRHLEVSYDGGVVRRTEVSYDGGVVRHLEVSYDGGVV